MEKKTSSGVQFHDKHVYLQGSFVLQDTYLNSMTSFKDLFHQWGPPVVDAALKNCDTQGEPVFFQGKTYYALKKRYTRIYSTLFGEVSVERYLYQSSTGGSTLCPMELSAGIIGSAAPDLARLIAFHYAEMPVKRVQAAFLESFQLRLTSQFIQNTAEQVAALLQLKEKTRAFEVPVFSEKVSSIAVGMDGTCAPIGPEGYRETMVGTFSFHNEKGKRLGTLYHGEAPQYGKDNFCKKMIGELESLKKKNPKALYLGLADGALFNWKFLQPHVHRMTLDYYHAASYVNKVAEILSPGSAEEWMSEKAYLLKNQKSGAKKILAEMQTAFTEAKTSLSKKLLSDSMTYFSNNLNKMNYSENKSLFLAIGSGVTESACKVIVKQRLCISGARWSFEGAQSVLTLRATLRSHGKWQKFWDDFQEECRELGRKMKK